MTNHGTNTSPEVLKAFRTYEARDRINNTKVGCFLVMTLMPLGIPMDFYVYPQHFNLFFNLRLCSAAIAAGIWAILYTKIGKRCGRLLGVVIPLVPVFFIAWMIAVTDGFISPYYAGLNLVLLAVGAVLRWTFFESILAVSIVLLIYIGTGILHQGPFQAGPMVNNFFFIACMDIIVVVGTFFQHRARFREFALRFELDENRKKLEESNRKLMELDEVKSRFFANISHELRTPLTLLLAPLETLLTRFKRTLDPDSANLLATMHSNGMRLLKLINDLLDLVRLDSGVMQVKREPVAVADFIKGLAAAARQMADDKRIRLETEVADEVGQVMVDRDKLEKVILNLQFNALKFTPAGGRVTLRGSREGEELVLSVADTGMGISKENLKNVFSRFWQADDSSRRKYQGVGIGLSLVKELIEVQGGSVAVVSEVGQGTTFTVRLPYLVPESIPGEAASPAEGEDPAASGASAAPPQSTVSNQEWLSNLYRRAELFPSMTSAQESVRQVDPPRNSNAPKLLVADDEPDMLRFIKSQLADHYQVLEAVDGQQAINKTTQFLPDIILLDMMMPEKDGLQACREIRERTSTRNIPIILLTARADEETKLAALEAGASDFLPKPFSTTELHVRIRNLVSLHQFQRTLSRQNQTLESTIEQLKETETLLVQTEKLASLGRMSAGIIHEINNPLNFAATGLFTLRKIAQSLTEKGRAEFHEVLRDIEDGLHRVKTIVSDLRSFSHQEDQQRDAVPVREVVDAALRFLSHEWKDRIRVEKEIPEDLRIEVNRNKMIQILVNLVQNSLDAMKAKDYQGESPLLRLAAREEKGRCLMVVRDNGQGIEPENIDKIFDPFFTTKDVGEGMGLGLSICYRIIQDFGGQVAVQSQPGQFCEFKLDFPLAA